MPRMSPRREPSTPRGNTLVASAVRMNGPTTRAMTNRKESWQSQGWRFYDQIGELRFAANWVGNVLSRATLFAGHKDPDGTINRVTTGTVHDQLQTLFGGPDSQAQMLKLFGVHLFVPGECYLVGRRPRPERKETGDILWEIVSTEEMATDGTTWRISYGDGLPDVIIEDGEDVIRIWNQHPRKRILADSPVRPQLENLAELLILSRTVTAQARSRLAGAGVYWVPSEFAFTPPADNPDATGVQGLVEILGGSMSAAIEDPTNPAALVPIIVSAPGDQIGNTKHDTFWSDFDEQLPDLRNEAIRRFALGVDIPAEVMLGTADLNHWSAWQVEESSIKATIEPLLQAICDSLKAGYLTSTNPADVIGFDTAAIRLRPNRSKEALELYDRVELSGEATRRETGFTEDDVPSVEEARMRLLLKLADGSSTPEQVAAAYQILGIGDIPGAEGQVREARPTPSLADHPTRDLPEQEPAPQQASLLDKSEVLVFRALERAGNRLRGRYQIKPPLPAADTYLLVESKVGDLDFLLEDAWSILPRLLPELPEVQRVIVQQALDTYCRHLLLNKRIFDRREMEHYLTSVPVRSL